MSTNLLSRISSTMMCDGLSPTQEMITYAIACDSYADGTISAEELQLGMCKYLDQSARRSRSLSEVINRIKEPSISEVFTECTIMMIDAVLRSKDFIHKGLKVTSENNIKIDKGKYVKPDVAIWRDDRIIGVIECKTSLGRARNEWENSFNERIKIFESVGINKDFVFLFVATENCWQGFPAADPRTMSTWFSICPKGTWFGGGKQGEVKLSEKMNKESLAKLIEKLKLL
ncbi:MAG: hypothetical protein EBU90_17055 [Proteobacteria bacterium]|nr:hypothetical protein [Pseudomonadota bacterium]